MCHIQITIFISNKACQLVTNYIEIRLYLSSILPGKSNNRSLYVQSIPIVRTNMSIICLLYFCTVFSIKFVITQISYSSLYTDLFLVSARNIPSRFGH